MGLFRAIKAHKLYGLGLDREKGRPTTQSALCTYSPQATKNSGIPIFQIHFAPAVSHEGIYKCSYQLKHTQMSFEHHNPTKTTFPFFHRNHFSSKFSCNINVSHTNALLIYHSSLSSEKIIIIIVIIKP